MPGSWDVAMVFGFPLIVVALAFGYAGFNRYLRYRERMAMIERGIAPPQRDDDDEAPTRALRDKSSPITVTLVGVAITLGLLTLGPGPWLIGGLVPTAYGCALLIRDMIGGKKKQEEGEWRWRGPEGACWALSFPDSAGGAWRVPGA